MANEKVKISWDEMNSPKVDAIVNQQNAAARLQQHYQQQVVAAPVVQPVRSAKSNIWYNSLFYMSVFGLIGGLCAWASGEFAWLAYPNQREEFRQAITLLQQVDQSLNAGEITKEKAERESAAISQTVKDNPYVKIYVDPALSDSEKDRQVNALLEKDAWKATGRNLAFFGGCGLFLGFWLALADSAAGRNRHGVIVHGATGAILGLVGGLIVSLFINQLYQALGGGNFGGDVSLTKQIFARSLGWAVLGSFLAIAPGIVLRSWKRFFIGLGGGFLGGLLGGLLFDPISIATNNAVVSRLVAILAIGTLIGVATGLIENAAKSGWLRVVAGLIAGKQFVIYKNPTYIGSSPQCEIYLFKDPRVAPRHAAIHPIPGGYDIEDLQSTTGTLVNGRPVARARLRNNDQVQIGGTGFQFQEKARSLT